MATGHSGAEGDQVLFDLDAASALVLTRFLQKVSKIDGPVDTQGAVYAFGARGGAGLSL